jgi:hypothetical protein
LLVRPTIQYGCTFVLLGTALVQFGLDAAETRAFLGDPALQILTPAFEVGLGLDVVGSPTPGQIQCPLGLSHGRPQPGQIDIRLGCELRWL